ARAAADGAGRAWRPGSRGGCAACRRWTLAIVAGGGATGLVQGGSALLRLKSSTFTAGVGNPVVATGELAGSLALAVLGLLAPLVAVVIVVILLALLGRRLLCRPVHSSR